jgi:hypothetical protein
MSVYYEEIWIVSLHCSQSLYQIVKPNQRPTPISMNSCSPTSWVSANLIDCYCDLKSLTETVMLRQNRYLTVMVIPTSEVLLRSMVTQKH